MMDLDDQAQEQGDDEMNYPTSSENQLTYDPTQGRGTPAWEASRKASMELNAQLRRN